MLESNGIFSYELIHLCSVLVYMLCVMCVQTCGHEEVLWGNQVMVLFRLVRGYYWIASRMVVVVVGCCSTDLWYQSFEKTKVLSVRFSWERRIWIFESMELGDFAPCPWLLWQMHCWLAFYLSLSCTHMKIAMEFI